MTDGKQFTICVIKHSFILFLLHLYSSFFFFFTQMVFFSVTSPVAFLDMRMIYPGAVYGLGCTKKHSQSFITYCNAPLLKEQELQRKNRSFHLKVTNMSLMVTLREYFFPLPCP